MTNMETDWNGNLIWADGTGKVSQLGISPVDSKNFLLTTKDFDFGQPGQRKKIYKVYVSYYRTSDASELALSYAINGSGIWKVISSSFPLHGGEAFPMKAESYDVDTITDFGVSDVESMRLMIHCTGGLSGSTPVGSDFTLNDMSIVFRTKPIR